MALSNLLTKQATKKAGKALTERQKKALQKELDEVQAGKSRGKTLEEVEKSYTPAEIRQMERELEKIKKSAQGMAKGGKVTKMMKGGYTTKGQRHKKGI